MVILGLDSSTSVTGWAFSKDGKVLDAGYIDTKKFETTKEKTFFVISELEKNPLIKEVTVINLEAALSGFAGGFTSQQVIITLARHNAVFAYIIEEHFKVKVNLLSVNTMRKQLFGKCRIKGIKSKDFVKSELESLCPDVIKFTVLNKKGNWDERNGDMYDGIVASLLEMNRNKILELAKKIKALAEKGKGGERNAAKEKLEKICEKYNISENEISISEERKNYYIIINDSNERELLINVSCMILDVPGFKWKEKNNCICIHITQSEYDNITSAFEYYRDMYNDYKRYLIQGIISRNTIGYIPKPQTYTQENIQQDIQPTPPTPETENVSENDKSENSEENNDESSDEDKKSEDVKKEDSIDPIKLMKIAVALEKKPWVKNDPNKKLIE